MTSPKAIARSYFDHWTAGRFDAAARLLSDRLVIETPMNLYAGKADFAAALAGFGAMVTATGRIADVADGEDVMQIYDMDVAGLGTIRVAEHFVVRGGQIVGLRQIHDTAALRAAGFERPSA